MIPQEVADIAQIIADDYNGEDLNGGYTYDEFIDVAYKIYSYIQKQQN